MGRIPTGTAVPLRGDPEPPRLQADDRGQLLILTGVLLVLGFVVIGTTVVQLQALEESTSRLQRDALLDSVDHLVANFNQTMAASIEIGETNTTDFKSRVSTAEKRLRDTATRSGLYVAVELNGDVDRDIFWRDSRCLAYNLDEWATGEGIVVGYERETTKETIAGAVYNLHFTDGRQTIHMDYYAKIFDCMVQNTPSHIVEAAASPGTVQNVTGSYQQDDVGLFWVNETLSGTVVKQQWTGADAGTLQPVGWNNAPGILVEGDGSDARKSLAVNYLDFKFEAPAGLQASHSIPNFEVSVHAKYNSGIGLGTDDYLVIEAYHEDDPTDILIGPSLVAVSGSWVNTTFQPPESPQGNAHWTLKDLEETVWRLRVQIVGLPDSGRSIHVDYVTANVSWEQPEGYQMDATFDFDEIPSIFDEHDVEVRYRLEQDPALLPDHTDHVEEFYLQVYDSEAGEWDTIDTWTDTGGTWRTFGPYRLLQDATNDQTNDNEPRFRLIDQHSTDDHDADYDGPEGPHQDRDSIEIDWFELTSSVSGT